jgi:hypothetical protein
MACDRSQYCPLNLDSDALDAAAIEGSMEMDMLQPTQDGVDVILP